MTRLVLCLASVAFAQSNHPIPSSFFAMSAVEGDYPKVNIGALAHQGFAWVSIERSRGKFDFAAFDAYMAQAQLHGLVDPAANTANFAMTLAAATPGWAVADHTNCNTGAEGVVTCTTPPDNIQDWKDFLNAVLQHYNGKTQPHIRYYELWNEFNVSLWWTGTDAQMLALAQAAYPIIHQDPYSILLTPSVAGPVGTTQPNSSVTVMTRYLQAGGSKYADGGAFHGYLGAQGAVQPFPMPEQDETSGCKPFVGCYGSIITKSMQMRAVFDQNGLAGKPMYQTEGSWGNRNVTDLDTQIQWVSRYNLLQAGLRSSLNLQMAAWFTWGGGTSFGWGDLEDDSLEPTAAGIAYGQVFHWVVGASIDQPCAAGTDGTWVCKLTRPAGYSAQAVWNVNGNASYKPGEPFTQYRDLAGNTFPIATGAAVTIGTKPILVEGIEGGAPVITMVANAADESAVIAPNTWTEIKGFNLAPPGHTRTWQGSDFVHNTMPTELDGVSVMVNGKSAYVYFISPTQVNFLTPPDAIQGPVQVQLTSGGASSSAATALAGPESPSFFLFGGGPYIAATHLDGTYLGPANLYPGAATPAKPGETIVLYANGFGATSVPVVSGSVSQSGTLAQAPVIKFGELTAVVAFAGLVSPGEFQFNVVVPPNAPAGDNVVVAMYGGLSTPAAKIAVLAGLP